MDKLTNYQTIVVELLTYYASLGKSHSDTNELEEQLILDKEHNHYQLLTIGWEGTRRVYYPVFHIDIKDGKIWIQEDATDFDFVGELERRGVVKSDIVLAFYSPSKRLLTEYAAK